MATNYVCDCLNVSIHISDVEVNASDLRQFHSHIDPYTESKQSDDICGFFTNATIVRLSSNGIVINYDLLCYRQTVDEWQINHCVICKMPTHATLTNRSSHDVNNGTLALVNSTLLHDPYVIEARKADRNYSLPFGIILPKTIQHTNSEQLNNVLWYLNFPKIEFQIKEKCQQFLYEEKMRMEKRIREYRLEQEDCFKKLFEETQMQEDEFIELVDSIKQLTRDDRNKENKMQTTVDDNRHKDNSFYTELTNPGESYIRKKSNTEEYRGAEPLVRKNSSSNPRDLDCLFDMDDIEIDTDEKLFLIDNESSKFEEDEEHDSFPLKESNLNSKEVNLNENNDLIREMSTSLKTFELNGRSRKSTSHVQNIPYSKNRTVQHQAANSLPIKIPHYRTRKVDFENDDNFKIKPGESIADSIQKMARSVRNENDILDDRPRRRLNTGDLIKSRPILN